MTGQMQATITRLRARERGPLEKLLMRDPITNVYLLSEIRERKMTTDWWGVLDAGEVRSAMLCGSLVVPYITDASDAADLGRILSDERSRVRMMVGPQASVFALHEAFGKPANDIRKPQLVMLLNRGYLRGDAQPTPLRPANRGDLEQLTEAAAAMHQEEMGIDPLSVDSEGWRVRMTQLIDRRWSWVWTEGGSMVFKAELSAWTSSSGANPRRLHPSGMAPARHCNCGHAPALRHAAATDAGVHFVRESLQRRCSPPLRPARFC